MNFVERELEDLSRCVFPATAKLEVKFTVGYAPVNTECVRYVADARPIDYTIHNRLPSSPYDQQDIRVVNIE